MSVYKFQLTSNEVTRILLALALDPSEEAREVTKEIHTQRLNENNENGAGSQKQRPTAPRRGRCGVCGEAVRTYNNTTEAASITVHMRASLDLSHNATEGAAK